MSYAKNITYAICEELLLRHFFATSFFKVLWGIFGPRRQWLSHYLSKSQKEIEHWVNFLVPLQQKKVGDLMFFCNHVFGLCTSKKYFMSTVLKKTSHLKKNICFRTLANVPKLKKNLNFEYCRQTHVSVSDIKKQNIMIEFFVYHYNSLF